MKKKSVKKKAIVKVWHRTTRVCRRLSMPMLRGAHRMLKIAAPVSQSDSTHKDSTSQSLLTHVSEWFRWSPCRWKKLQGRHVGPCYRGLWLAWQPAWFSDGKCDKGIQYAQGHDNRAVDLWGAAIWVQNKAIDIGALFQILYGEQVGRIRMIIESSQERWRYVRLSWTRLSPLRVCGCLGALVPGLSGIHGFENNIINHPINSFWTRNVSISLLFWLSYIILFICEELYHPLSLSMCKLSAFM